MKTHVSLFLLIGLLSMLMFSWGCNKDSTTAPTDTASISGSGSDYFPLTGNQTIIGKATGQTVIYDSLGNIVQSQAISQQQVKGYIGTATTVGGLQAYPLYSYQSDGTTLSSTNSFIAQNSQAIVGFGSNASISQLVTALPAELKVGKTWTANPTDPLNKEVTLQIVANKTTYTNSAGQTYSNVIDVNATMSDSTLTTTNYYYGPGFNYSIVSIIKKKVNADIYFAKGIGFVDIQLNQYEEMEKDTYGGLFSGSYYSRKSTTGTLGRSN
jgi:hypothetical protein